MRTNKQILNRIKQIEKDDFFGFERNDLIMYLDQKHSKPFFKDGYDGSDWKPLSKNKKDILKQMYDYMEFAWDKAKNCRGISASRSMSHYSAWIWMLGDEDVFGNLQNYNYYGKDNLVKICEHYGWDYKKWDDGIRVNSEEELENI